jgi:hypothetical protein
VPIWILQHVETKEYDCGRRRPDRSIYPEPYRGDAIEYIDSELASEFPGGIPAGWVKLPVS